jgi:hypothetical protein
MKAASRFLDNGTSDGLVFTHPTANTATDEVAEGVLICLRKSDN